MAKTIVLKFAHPYPPMHPQHKGVLVPWAKKIEEASGGAVKIKFIPGGALGKPGQAYDMVEKNIADIGWDIADYTPGRFPLTTVIELPFMVQTAEKASVALWKTYEQFPEFQKEYADTKLLMLSAHAPGFFATVKKPVKSLADLKGLKIKTASSFTTNALELFGAVPVTQPVTETYTSLERGVLDGVVMPFDGIVIFKLNELLKYYTPADFYSLVFWVAMNKHKFESLPDNVQQIIEENSGLSFSRAFGKSFDQTYAAMKQVCLKTGMQEVKFPDSEMQKLIQLTEPMKDQWVKEMEAKGLPGKAVLEAVTRFSNE
ncbi:MAG: TRAP transporter substrate-binding protein [Desulfosarcinaceae bacterium]